MKGRTGDPIIQKARRHMVRARPLFREAVKELEAAQRGLERHPDFKMSVKADAAGKPARERITLASWYHSGILSILDDMRPTDAASCISNDLRGNARTMELFIRDEEEVLAAQAARRAARRLAA